MYKIPNPSNTFISARKSAPADTTVDLSKSRIPHSSKQAREVSRLVLHLLTSELLETIPIRYCYDIA
jgi:hypothetical protein